MRCNKCGTLIENQNGICPVCSSAFQNNIPQQTFQNVNQNQIQPQMNQNMVYPQMVQPVMQNQVQPQMMTQPVNQNVNQNQMQPQMNQNMVYPQMVQPVMQNQVQPQMVTQQVNQNVQSQKEPTKKKSKKKKLFIGLFSLVIVAVVSIGLYFVLVIDKPRQLFITSLDVLKSQINNTFAINRKSHQISYRIRTELNENDEVYGSVYKNLNEFTLDIDLFNNIEENYSFFELITTYQYKNHLNLIGVLDHNLFHINSPGDFEEFYAFDTHNNIYANINRISDQEALIIINGIINSFENVLKSDYFTKEEKNITVDGKQMNLIVNNFIINETNVKEIIPEIIEILRNDVDFINACAKSENIDGVEFKGKLNKLEESILIDEYKIPEMVLSIYLNENDEIKGIAIKYKNKIYNMFFEKNNIKIYEGFDNKIIELQKDETKYTIIYNGGKIYIEYKLIENPVFSKPVVDGKTILFETLTEKEKTDLEKVINEKPVMETFMYDFERFFKSIEMTIEDFLEPSKNIFKQEIEKVVDAARNEHLYTQTLSGNNIYTNEVLIPGNKLNINKVNSIYYVKLNEEGMVKRVFYMDGLYCYDSSKLQNVENITKQHILDEHIMVRTKKDSYDECKSNYSLFE